MTIKEQMCERIYLTKKNRGLTYDAIVEICNGGIHKSQLTLILKHSGESVSLETIEYVLNKLDIEVRVEFVEKLYDFFD